MKSEYKKVLTYTGALVWALTACTPAVGTRGAEPPRPEALRLAGSDYPAGAHQQSIDDTLEGSATVGALAPGWYIQDGSLRYDEEARKAGGMPPVPKAPPTEEECHRALEVAKRAGVGQAAVDPRCQTAP